MTSTMVVDRRSSASRFADLPHAVFEMIPDVYAFKLYAWYVKVVGQPGLAECWQSRPELAKNCGMSEGKVWAARKVLEDLGLISIRHIGELGKQRSYVDLVDVYPVYQSWRETLSLSDGETLSPHDRGGRHHMTPSRARQISGEEEPIKKNPENARDESLEGDNQHDETSVVAEPGDQRATSPTPKRPPAPAAAKRIMARYKALIQPQARVSAEEQIVRRLKTFTEAEIDQAIVSFAGDAWWMEHNGKRGALWFFKSDAHIEQFMNIGPRTPAAKANGVEERERVYFDIDDDYNRTYVDSQGNVLYRTDAQGVRIDG